VKAIQGKKTDKRDAKWTADIFNHTPVAGSFILPADIRQLLDLFRHRWKLTNFTTCEKNEHRIVLLSPTSNWMMYSRMASARLTLQLPPEFWTPQRRESQMLLPFVQNT